jgi:UDP-N-acetylglucosamine:LPS N-acetylglucosamine transferase
LYLANISEQQQEMLKRGVVSKHIAVCGLTLKPKKQRDPEAVRKSLGLKPGAKLILFSSGSLGTQVKLSWLEQVVDEVCTRDSSTHIVIVTGKNRTLYETLVKRLKQPQVHLFGYHEDVSLLYEAASVFLTKPGGLTIVEALQYKLPVIVTQYLPGQEELNMKYLALRNLITLGMKQGKVITPSEIVSIMEKELGDGALKSSLIANSALADLVQDSVEKSPLIQAVKLLFNESGRTV